MKLYYDDPLIAAYMHKYFNVEFIEDAYVGDFWFDDILNEPDDNGKPQFRLARTDLPLYIHPDSIGIFEPQVGDLITSKHEFELNKSDDECSSKFLIEKSDELFNLTCLSQFILTEDNYDCAWSDYHWKGQEIIQRNGKNFFMPKFEELSK